MNVGWKHIWKLYGWKELFSKKNKLLYFTLWLSLTALLVVLILNDVGLTYDLTGKIIDIGISILPTLLGFNLGAYALIIGFLTNKNLVKAITEKRQGDASSAFETMSGVFAFNIIAQAFTLLLAFLIKEIIILLSNIHLSSKLSAVFYNVTYITALDSLTFFGVMFSIVYSICLVIQNAINIFDFNQLFTYFSLKKDDDVNE